MDYNVYILLSRTCTCYYVLRYNQGQGHGHNLGIIQEVEYISMLYIEHICFQ